MSKTATPDAEAPVRERYLYQKANREIAELKLAESKKAVIPCNLVATMMSVMIKNVRDTALNLPNKCSQFVCDAAYTNSWIRKLEKF
jgi:hypothetical protein